MYLIATQIGSRYNPHLTNSNGKEQLCAYGDGTGHLHPRQHGKRGSRSDLSKKYMDLRFVNEVVAELGQK